MITYYQTVRTVAQRIADAINRSIAALDEGRGEHEPAMTDRMLGAIEESVNGFVAKGIKWSAKTLTDRGGGSQESLYGADFMGVLNINLPDFKVAKGFLAQAKLIRNGRLGDISELKSQCEKMLAMSSQSFVFLYGNDGVRIVPAISVLATDESPLALYSRSAQRFFEEHLQCFVGDKDIQNPTPAQLTVLLRNYQARSALLVGAEAAP